MLAAAPRPPRQSSERQWVRTDMLCYERTVGRTVNGLLGGGGGVDGGHETLNNGELEVSSVPMDHGIRLTLSLMTLARGAKQLVVHEALEMTWYSDL